MSVLMSGGFNACDDCGLRGYRYRTCCVTLLIANTKRSRSNVNPGTSKACCRSFTHNTLIRQICLHGNTMFTIDVKRKRPFRACSVGKLDDFAGHDTACRIVRSTGFPQPHLPKTLESAGAIRICALRTSAYRNVLPLAGAFPAQTTSGTIKGPARGSDLAGGT